MIILFFQFPNLCWINLTGLTVTCLFYSLCKDIDSIDNWLCALEV